MLNNFREVLSSWEAFLDWKQSEVTPHKPVQIHGKFGIFMPNNNYIVFCPSSGKH